MNITTDREAAIAHAREVDTKVAAMYDVYYELSKKFAEAEARKDSADKSAEAYRSYGDSAWNLAQADKAEARSAAAAIQMAELADQAHAAKGAAFDFDQANYGGWQRFFLVEHIHRSMHCSSFRATTRIGWLPELSGLVEAEAVAAKGAILCTICFPTAPVEFTNGFNHPDPDACPGSGQYHSTEHLTGREHAYSSPSGYCPECGRWNTVTKSGAMRKHKVDETRRHW